MMIRLLNLKLPIHAISAINTDALSQENARLFHVKNGAFAQILHLLNARMELAWLP